MSFKKKSRIIALIMLIAAVVFFVFSITHPTSSFPWSNTITYFIYAVYILIMVVLFVGDFDLSGYRFIFLAAG